MVEDYFKAAVLKYFGRFNVLSSNIFLYTPAIVLLMEDNFP